MKIEVLYEDNHIIAVEKNSGILTQQDYSNSLSLIDYIKSYIKKKYQKQGNVFLGMVHRLDKPVSGAIIFARTSKSANRLHDQFISNKVLKIYIALVKKCDNNTKNWIELEHHITKQRGFSLTSENKFKNSKIAKLRYIELASNNEYSLLLVQIFTGRKHQIRAQLSTIGCPIVGDEKYGSNIKLVDNSICLHSLYISFYHPTKKNRINIFSKVPDRFSNIFKIDSTLKKKIFNIINEIELSQ